MPDDDYVKKVRYYIDPHDDFRLLKEPVLDQNQRLQQEIELPPGLRIHPSYDL
jgi:hypothetical protein